ncbi:MAG: hypothetical protein RIS20_1205 [Bacteroidota bacterium]|jgi:hypothetical protein
MKAITSIICVFVPFLLMSQWSNMTREEYGKLIHEIDQKMAQSESLSYEAKQAFFSSAESNDTINAMLFSFHYQHDLKILNIHQFNTLLVQDSLVSVRIDSLDRIVMIQEPNLELMEMIPRRNFSEFYQSGAQVQKLKLGNEMIYKVTFDTLSMYRMMKMWVNAKGEITKYSLVAGRPVLDSDSNEEKYIYPRMDVSLFRIKRGKEVNSNELVKPSFFFTDSSCSTLKTEFDEFEIWDTRSTNKTE